MWSLKPLAAANPRPSQAKGRCAGHGAARRSTVARRWHLEALEDRSLLSFSPAVAYPVGLTPLATVAGDFNNDGRTDLVAANRGESTVSVVLGIGGGAFQAARSSGTGTRPESVVAGDLNRDGTADLVTVNIWDDYAHQGDLSVLLGHGDGLFQTPRSVAPPAQTPPGYVGGSLNQVPRSALLGDLNADGKFDLVVGGTTTYYVEIGYDWDTQSPIYEYHSDGYLNVLLGVGDGTFGIGTAYHLGSYVAAHHLAIGDFDGDGRLDIVTDAGGLTTLLGNGDGTLQAPLRSAGSGYSGVGDGSLPAADFDRDGTLDLLMRDGTGNGVIVMLGNSDGTFRQTEGMAIGSIHAASAGDVNADGKPDIVVMNSNYTDEYQVDWTSFAHVLLGRGDGTFAPAILSALVTAPNTYFSSAVLADLNGDGSLDLAGSASPGVWDEYGNSYDTQGFLAVSLNDGTWTLPPPPPPSVSVGDVTVIEGHSGTRVSSFTVTLSSAYDRTVTVPYASADGTATAGGDYQARSGTLSFAPGQTSMTIAILINGDRLGEQDETFVVNLGSPVNATIADGQGVATILDDEPRISISDVTRAEGKNRKTTLFTFTVTLSAAYDHAVTMSFRTSNGSAITSGGDYVARTGTLTFAPGETSKTITITVQGDNKREADETFYLDLFGNGGHSLLAKSRGLGTILNDD